LVAMRPAALGTAMLTNWIADWRTIVGFSGIGAVTAAMKDVAPGSNSVWPTMNPASTQTHVAVCIASHVLAESVPASC